MRQFEKFEGCYKFKPADAAGVVVHDMLRPALARAARLHGWSGFGLRSLRPATPHGPAEEGAIEVKCRAGPCGMEVSRIEWAKACNLRNRSWHYIAFDCAPRRPRLVKAQNPLGKLLAKANDNALIVETEMLMAATELRGGT
ncbi:MAG: hypothetical protein KatS3mg119_0394 [Rhodothalassiaceae bacterium]|nr:MAG: hypothetical protein KatS3mg119_0394 [Rhodothalassiaceae bacterium]